MPSTLAQVNALTREEFEASFGDVAEHSPWVAAAAAAARPFASREAMIAAFVHAIAAAGKERQLALLRGHPDLAARARLTATSANEQRGAGLDSLGPEEYSRFSTLNSRYLAAFGFPFIFAVKGATTREILAAFEERVRNTPEVEFAAALGQVSRILRFRIEDRVAP